MAWCVGLEATKAEGSRALILQLRISRTDAACTRMCHPICFPAQRSLGAVSYSKHRHGAHAEACPWHGIREPLSCSSDRTLISSVRPGPELAMARNQTRTRDEPDGSKRRRGARLSDGRWQGSAGHEQALHQAMGMALGQTEGVKQWPGC